MGQRIVVMGATTATRFSGGRGFCGPLAASGQAQTQGLT